MEPRKWPIQERSVASVDAILDATIQVLLRVGKEQLTTTKVAMRAGVSVGSLYQYFPNKSSLLQAALKRHLSEVSAVVESVCVEQRGRSVQEMAVALATAFLDAKMRDPKTSVALYSVSSDVDGQRIAQEVSMRMNEAIAEMLVSAREPLRKDPRLLASMLQGTMAGISRRLLESGRCEEECAVVRGEMIALISAYVAGA